MNFEEMNSSLKDYINSRRDIASVLSLIEKKRIPKNFPLPLREALYGFEIRDKIIESMGYSFICDSWIVPLTHWISGRKCLEIMAGSGALSYALKRQGVDIIPTDNHSWERWFNKPNALWVDVIKKDCLDAIEEYGRDVDIIIMSWAYMDDMAYKSLLKMREVNDKCIMVYIGEDQGGCTANDDFFENARIINNDPLFTIASQCYKSWYGMHDELKLIK